MRHSMPGLGLYINETEDDIILGRPYSVGAGWSRTTADELVVPAHRAIYRYSGGSLTTLPSWLEEDIPSALARVEREEEEVYCLFTHEAIPQLYVGSEVFRQMITGKLPAGRFAVGTHNGAYRIPGSLWLKHNLPARGGSRAAREIDYIRHHEEINWEIAEREFGISEEEFSHLFFQGGVGLSQIIQQPVWSKAKML